jgi:hypothetical protein
MSLYPDYSKEEVDMMLQETQQHTCIICGQPPVYRIIPYPHTAYTAEIQDKGYICQHCVNMKYIDPVQYGLRPLQRSNPNGTVRD